VTTCLLSSTYLTFFHSPLIHTPCNQTRVELDWRMDEEPDELMRD